MPGDGSLRTAWDAGPPRLVLAGNIDLTSHTALIAAMAKAAGGAGQVYIDMARVSFCDVAGLRILMHGGDRQRSDPARVTLLNLSPHLKKLLHLLGQDTAAAPAASACAPMPDDKFPVEMVQGVPVVAAPAEIDINNAQALRSALLTAAADGHGTFVVDMTRTRFCDSAGLRALIAAHHRARTERGQLLLVIPGTPVLRVLALTGLDRVVPSFTTLAEALEKRAATADGRRQPAQGDGLAEDQPL
jgi:anti-sigma B factor antagonist